MTIKTNDLQFIYNDFSNFLFDNLKSLRKNIKKDIKKEIKQIEKELFLKNINKYIYDIVDDIITKSGKKKSKKHLKDVNVSNINIPDGYKLCNKNRTKNRGLCKKICKINEDGCIFHKDKNNEIVKQNDNIGIKTNVNNYDNNLKIENKSSNGFPLEINKNNKKINRKKKIYIPNNITCPYENDEFPTLRQTQIPGQIFKKNNKLYTINIYNKEIIADAPNGIKCYYCNTIRYTQSGPCVNYNCKNKKK
jgi:hypothetical protein